MQLPHANLCAALISREQDHALGRGAVRPYDLRTPVRAGAI